MIIHISQQRYDTIKSQGYGRRVYSQEDSTAIKPLEQGDFEFHVLDSERSFCEPCGAEFASVVVNTPADLENIKWELKRSAA